MCLPAKLQQVLNNNKAFQYLSQVSSDIGWTTAAAIPAIEAKRKGHFY